MSFNGGIERYLKTNLVTIPIFMLAYYLLRVVQIPFLFRRKKHFIFFVSLIASVFLLTTLYHIAWTLWLDDAVGRILGVDSFFKIKPLLTRSIRFYAPSIVLLTWGALNARKKQKEQLLSLELEKYKNELQLLKTQISPHFLLNTLNSINAEVIKQSPKSLGMIMGLSTFLDYVIYKGKKSLVSIKEEIDAVKNFTDLEKIRLEEKFDMNFSFKGNYKSQISPLILLSLVEILCNNQCNVDGVILNIDIKERNGGFHCSFEFNSTKQPSIKLPDLNDFKKRLHLEYDNNHMLSIKSSDEFITIVLSLNTTA